MDSNDVQMSHYDEKTETFIVPIDYYDDLQWYLPTLATKMSLEELSSLVDENNSKLELLENQIVNQVGNQGSLDPPLFPCDHLNE